MKKYIIKALLIASFSLMSAASQAAPSVWTGWYPVDEIFTYSDGLVLLSLNPKSAHSNPSGCRLGSFLAVPKDQANVKDVYQMALTAQAAGLKINAYVSGTVCGGSYPKIDHLRSRQ